MLIEVRLYRQFDQNTVEMLLTTAPCNDRAEMAECVGAAIVATEFWARCPVRTAMTGELFLDNGIGSEPTVMGFAVNKQYEDRVHVSIGKEVSKRQ